MAEESADVLLTPLGDKTRIMYCRQLGNRTFPAIRQPGTMPITASATAFGTQLTPKKIMTKNILKNTRKTAMSANAIGKIPTKVVAALITTEGPISAKALAILASFDSPGFCSIQYRVCAQRSEGVGAAMIARCDNTIYLLV